MSDAGIMKELDLGRFGSAGLANVGNSVPAVEFQFPLTVVINNSANGAVPLGEQVIYTELQTAVRVKAVTLNPSIAVTSGNTNFVTFNLFKRTANGTATTILAANTETGGTGNMVAFGDYTFRVGTTPGLTANATDLALGDKLTWSLTANSSGVAISATNAAATVTILLERI